MKEKILIILSLLLIFGKFTFSETNNFNNNKHLIYYSVLIPGLGQYKNGDTLKSLFYFSTSSIFLANTIYYWHLEEKQWDKYTNEFSLNGNTNMAKKYYNDYQTYHENKLSSAWLFGFFYLLNIADIYVDINLKDFNTDLVDLFLKDYNIYLGVNLYGFRK